MNVETEKKSAGRPSKKSKLTPPEWEWYADCLRESGYGKACLLKKRCEDGFPKRFRVYPHKHLVFLDVQIHQWHEFLTLHYLDADFDKKIEVAYTVYHQMVRKIYTDYMKKKHEKNDG